MMLLDVVQITDEINIYQLNFSYMFHIKGEIHFPEKLPQYLKEHKEILQFREIYFLPIATFLRATIIRFLLCLANRDF